MSADEMVVCLCGCGCRERIYPQSGTDCARCLGGDCVEPDSLVDWMTKEAAVEARDRQRAQELHAVGLS